MRAIHLTAYGDPLQVLQCVEVPEPTTPADDEVLVQMHYSPVNTTDLLLAKGMYAAHPETPAVIGNEGVGVVFQVGKDVKKVKAGDRVLISRQPFAWAETVIAKEENLFVLPPGIDLVQASMLSINTTTASLLLTHIVGLQPGSWVVQNAGNSGVGRAVIAIAKSRGIKTISLVRRPELVEELVRAGGDVVLVSSDNAPLQANAVLAGAQVKLGLDGVGGHATVLLGAIASENAVIVNYAAMSGEPVAINAPDLVFKKILLRGFFMYHPEFLPYLDEAMAEGATLIASGELNTPVAAIYPMEKIADAIAHHQSGGKVILNIAAVG